MTIVSWRPKGQKLRNPDTIVCPKCGELAKIVSIPPERVRYRCVACESIFTDPNKATLAKMIMDKKRDSVKSPVIIRDRSKSADSGAASGQNKKPGESETDTKQATVEGTLRLIRQSMLDRRIFSFAYDANGAISNRSVEPYKLTVNNKTSEYVLFGYCVDKGSIRAFRVSLMSACAVQEFTFEQRWPVEDQTIR